MTKMATAGTPYRHQLGKSAGERICIPDLALSEWFHSTVNSGSCRRNTKLSNGTSLASDGSLTRSYPGYFVSFFLFFFFLSFPQCSPLFHSSYFLSFQKVSQIVHLENGSKDFSVSFYQIIISQSQKSPRVVTPNIGAIVDIMDESRKLRLKNVPIID